MHEASTLLLAGVSARIREGTAALALMLLLPPADVLHHPDYPGCSKSRKALGLQDKGHRPCFYPPGISKLG